MYLQHLVLVKPLLLPAAIVEVLELLEERLKFVQHLSFWTHSLLPAPDPRQPATKHCTP